MMEKRTLNVEGTSHEKFFNDIESGKKGEWGNNLDVEDRNW